MKKFNDYNLSDLSFEQLKNDLIYEFGIQHRDKDSFFSDEGFIYWQGQLKDFDSDLIHLYENFTNQILNILLSIYPNVFSKNIIELVCKEDGIIRITGEVNTWENCVEFNVSNYEQTPKDIVLSFYIQSKLLLLGLEYFQFHVCKNVAIKEVYEVLNSIISKMKFDSRKVSFSDRINFETEKINSPITKMQNFVLEYLISLREEIYHESIVKIHSSSLSKTTTGKNDYTIDDFSGATKDKPTHFLFNKDYYFKKESLTNYINNHDYFIANNTKGIITKNPKGFNIACAILCRQMIAKGWIKENTGARELMKFIKDEFNITARAHHPFASSEQVLKEQYTSTWNLFNNMPTPN